MQELKEAARREGAFLAASAAPAAFRAAESGRPPAGGVDGRNGRCFGRRLGQSGPPIPICQFRVTAAATQCSAGSGSGSSCETAGACRIPWSVCVVMAVQSPLEGRDSGAESATSVIKKSVPVGLWQVVC